MRKAFKLQDLDCANCAAKMENAISNIDGVKSATVSFMTQKLVLEADDDRFEAVLDEAEHACRKICLLYTSRSCPPRLAKPEARRRSSGRRADVYKRQDRHRAP